MSAEQPESLTTRAYRSVLMGVATGGVGAGLASPAGADVTGHGADLVEDGSVLHHGPGDEQLLDRPSGGYLADASTQSGVAIDRSGDGVSSIARSIDDAGRLEIDGQVIEVLDYAPGGDMVQAMAGHADPGQLAMNLVRSGIEQEMERSGATTDVGRVDGDILMHGADTVEPQGAEAAGIGSGAASIATGASGMAAGRTMPDQDEDARDLEQLSLAHARDLDVAVETSDASHVHTEIHAHGRTLSIDTDFEARAPDNGHERHEAEEHVRDVLHAGRSDVEHVEPGMRFRSQVAAHLDAQARDEGLSR